MKPRLKPHRPARHAAALLMIACTQFASAASIQSFGQGSDSDDARFGAEVGAATAWQPSYVPLTGSTASLGFNGHPTLSCDHIDFKGFLSQFNPGELIHDMKDVVMHGAQAAAFDYLMALAYSTPTVASVLDMMDKRLADRFHAFAQTCSVQQARRIGEEQGAKKMADASDQCFAKQVGGGASPTDAYRTCSIDHAFGALDLPALSSTTDFLRRYTNLNVTREIEVLLGMLPDERIQDGALQMRAPPTSVAAMTDGLRQRARAALDLVEGGADPTHIAACTADDLSGAGGGDPACLPATAAALVASPAFRGVRLLNAQSRELYKDALSSQIASVAAYSNILELQQQIARLDVKSNSGVDAQEAMTRRQHLLDQSNRLLGQADTQVRIEEGKLRIARTQLLALEHAEDRLHSAGLQLAGENRSQSFGVRDFVRLFVDH